MKKFKSYSDAFYNSYYYPIIIIFSVFLGHTFGLELFSIIICGASASLGLFCCKKLNFILSPALSVFFCLSKKNAFNGEGNFFSIGSLIVVFVIASIFIVSLVLHFIINRNIYNFKSPTKSPLFLGFMIFSIAIILNGLFAKDSFSWLNLGFSFVLAISYFGTFYLWYIGIDFENDFKKYCTYILFLVSILITLEFYSLFLNGQIKFENGEIIKESIVTGWGIWNTMGCYLSMLLPIHFIFASHVKKYGFLFYGTGIISYLAIVLSLSRSSLIAGTLVIAISVITSCFVGENKKTNRLITCSLALLGICGIIIFWDNIANVFADYLSRGLDDNGRFEIYKFGISKFLQYPIFGDGFYNSIYKMDTGLPFGYHNTIVQMMASCGIVGLLCYLFHRYQTILLAIKRRGVDNLYYYLCICALLITSLFDVHMISLYPSIFYTLILVSIEKTK